MKQRCGLNAQRFSGSRMVIGIHGFFHSKSSERRCRNYIKGLFDEEGWWCTQPGRVVDIVIQFYQNLFTSSNPNSFEEIPDSSSGHRRYEFKLMSEFIAQEVEIALKQMTPLKLPGPDGMPSIFYQNYWSLIGNDVTEAILLYLNTSTLPSALCHSFFTLIPKVKNLEYISQYHPICLNNVLYMVFS